MNFYDQAKILVDTPAVNDLFKFSASDAQRYGNSSFGNGCLVAKQLLAGGRGARFVMVSVGGWDMHSNIYNRTAATNLYTPGRPARPGAREPHRRPQGDAREDGGQDALRRDARRRRGRVRPHGRETSTGRRAATTSRSTAPSSPAAASRAGRSSARPTRRARTITDSGVTGRTELRAEDLACTVYSALGIDWTTTRHDDPLGRGFEYVPNAAAGRLRADRPAVRLIGRQENRAIPETESRREAA